MRVTVKDVTKRFGTTIALENVSLEVGDGELVALVGPSGCGKTTLLRLIAGFEAPDAGDILFNGRSVLGVPPERRGIGLVFQNYALFPHMTVFQNVAYGLKFRPNPLAPFPEREGGPDFVWTVRLRQPKAGEDVRRAKLAKGGTVSGPGEAWRVRELLELVGLSGLEDRMPSELSAGQQQRVALARALAPNPQVLLLDEPLSALDAKLRERLRLEIKKIQRTLKITTIYVTHDQEEALAVADRVAVMSVAHLEQIGTPREVYNTPATEFVARFIGRGNILPGELVGADAKHVLVRPERIRLNQSADYTLSGKIIAMEFAGDALWLHVDVSGTALIVRASSLDQALHEGDVVQLGIDRSDLYILPSDRRSPPTRSQAPSPR
jgi:thiamine transport system ATP-binding protein